MVRDPINDDGYIWNFLNTIRTLSELHNPRSNRYLFSSREFSFMDH